MAVVRSSTASWAPRSVCVSSRNCHGSEHDMIRKHTKQQALDSVLRIRIASSTNPVNGAVAICAAFGVWSDCGVESCIQDGGIVPMTSIHLFTFLTVFVCSSKYAYGTTDTATTRCLMATSTQWRASELRRERVLQPGGDAPLEGARCSAVRAV